MLAAPHVAAHTKARVAANSFSLRTRAEVLEVVGEESVRAALAPIRLIALVTVQNVAVDTFTADSADFC